MFDDGIANEFEEAHQKGLNRGFDLGWSYKGQFDRSIIRGHLEQLEKRHKKTSDPETGLRILSQKDILRQALKEMENHPCNRERIYK
jgi:predicted transcriptional regulator